MHAVKGTGGSLLGTQGNELFKCILGPWKPQLKKAIMPLCPYSASNPTKTLSAEPDHSFLMLSSLFLNVSNDGSFPTSGGNSTLQEKKKNYPQKEFKWTKSLLLPASHGCSSIPSEMSHCRDAFKGTRWGSTTNCKKTLYPRTIL